MLKNGVAHSTKMLNPDVANEDLKQVEADEKCKSPCHIYNNNAKISGCFKIASENLKADGLDHLFKNSTDEPIVQLGLNEEDYPVKCIDILCKFMIEYKHRVNMGNVYYKPEKGNFL